MLLQPVLALSNLPIFFAVLNMSEDRKAYILSITYFVNASSQYGYRNLTPGSLGAAAFWVGLRQDIYLAVMKREPVRLRLVPSLIDELGPFGEADDCSRANRAVVHCAEVLSHCFGPESVSVTQWRELCWWNDEWSRRLPDSYAEVYKDSDGIKAFPEIWYRQSCHGRCWAGSPSGVLGC